MAPEPAARRASVTQHHNRNNALPTSGHRRIGKWKKTTYRDIALLRV
jgi:hypothetical protein